MVQTGLDDPLEKWNKPESVGMSKVVRDLNYHMLYNGVTELKQRGAVTCAWVLEVLREHPEGITDKGIVKELFRKGTPLPKSSVNGRRNDLINRYGYNIVTYDGKPEPDHRGKMRNNSLWRILE